MRTLKFRAWDGEKMSFPFTFGHDLAGDYHKETHHVMQFTGLLDRNNMEVWEGDVILFQEPSLKSEMLKCEVVFYEGSFCAKWRNGWIPVWDFVEDFEVVGNIYEHKHLLEKP